MQIKINYWSLVSYLSDCTYHFIKKMPSTCVRLSSQIYLHYVVLRIKPCIYFLSQKRSPIKNFSFKGFPFQGDPLQADLLTLICLYLPRAKQRSQFSSLLAGKKQTVTTLSTPDFSKKHSVCKNN